VPGRPGPELAAQGVDIILNPSASHFAFGKHEVRKQIVIDASRTFGATYVYTNLIGNEAGRVIYDGEALIASAGKLIARARASASTTCTSPSPPSTSTWCA
jgi:NAD+ synthase (glutamine-hydrolysing)